MLNLKTIKRLQRQNNINSNYLIFKLLAEEKLVSETTITLEALKRKHPDNIDNAAFWREIYDIFPFHAVHTNVEIITNMAASKHRSLINARHIMKVFYNSFKGKKNLKFLEIGSGYGFVHKHMERILHAEGWAVDYCSKYKHKRLLVTDGRIIPDEIPELDFAYSTNVFQHLSRTQKDVYYNQVFKRLKNEGIFIVNDFVMTEELKKTAIKAENGKFVMQFFDQFVEIYNDQNEFVDHVRQHGFTIIGYNNMYGYCYGLILKKQ